MWGWEDGMVIIILGLGKISSKENYFKADTLNIKLL